MAAAFLVILVAIIFALCALSALRSAFERTPRHRHSRWQERSRNSRDGFKSRIGAK